MTAAAEAPERAEPAGRVTYEIRITGCDETTAFAMRLTEAEVITVRRVADRSRQASSFSCEPVLRIEPARNGRDSA